jgi:bacterioferritin
MKATSEVLQYLNNQLHPEQSAVNQYLLHSQQQTDWGIEKMAATEHKEALEEVEHADLLIARILYLEGTPKVEGGEAAEMAADVTALLERDLALEQSGINDLREGVKACDRANDPVSRDLFVKILTDEEGHEDHLATQLDLIGKIGIENYIATQL